MTAFRRFLALSLVIAVVAPLGPVYAAGDHFPGPDYTPAPASGSVPNAPPAAGGDGRGESGILSTVPSYDDELDDGYIDRWNGLPAQVFSPDGDGVQDTVTFTWEETYPGRPEVPGDPGAEPPVEGQPAIPPGADTSLWVMKPVRKADDLEQHWCVMPTARVGPGEVSFTWDGTAGGGLLVDDWYYWYTKRINPETGEEEISALGRVLIDTAVTELRKVLTLEVTPGQLAIRLQGHDERSGIRTVGARILPASGGTPVWSDSADFEPPNWRWWPDQEWARFSWPIAGLGTDYTLEITVTDFGGNLVTERVPLWPPVSRTGEEAFWTLAEGEVLGESFAVNAGSGNLVLARNDLWLPGLGPSLELTRTYSSQLRRNGAFGWGFASNYEERIEIDKADGSLVYTDPDGPLHVFERAAGGGGSYVGLPVVNPPGLFFRLEVLPDPNGRDESYRITQKDGLVAEFNIHGRLVARRDKNGNTMAFAYYDDGNLARVTDTSGRSLVFTYEGDTLAPSGLRYAKVASVEEEFVDPDSGLTVPGRKVSFVYSPAGDLVSATDLAGVATSFQWDDRHRLAGMTVSRDGDPYPITIAYDARNALATIQGTRDDGVLERWTGNLAWAGSSLSGGTYALSDPLGTYTYGFNGMGNVTSLTPPKTGTRTYVWAQNLLRSSTDGRGNATLFDYDNRGNPTTMTEPGAEPTQYLYDANNDLRTVIDPLGRIASYEYDGSRNLTRIIDGREGVTVYKYYPNGLVREETQPGRAPVTYVYDDQGNLLSSDDGRALTTCVYDLYGNATLELVTARGGSGQSRTETQYDLRGNALWTLDPVGVATTREYDENGDCTRATIEDEGDSTRATYEYDASLNLRRAVEEYTVTEWLYDAAGNCTERLVRDRYDPEGFRSRIVYAYNEEGQCVSTTSPLGAVTSFDYDLAGRLEAESTAILGKTYKYDTRGNLRRVEDTENGLACYDHNDANERMSATVYRDGLPQVTSFTYDGASGLESVEYPGRHLVYYLRDRAGDVTDEIHYGLTPTTQGAALTLPAPGDLAPRPRTESSVPAGAVEVMRLSYGYDDFGNVTSVTDGEGNGTAYTYDYLGHRSSQTDATGVTTSYESDSMGRLLQSRDSAGLVTWYRYDRLGNVLAEGDQEGLSTYVYDEQGRLRETRDRGGGLAVYAHDAGGNRLSITQEVGDGRVARRSFTYDGAGNVTSQLDGEDHLATFEFDEFGRCWLEQREGLNEEQAVENHFEYDGKSRTTAVVDARDNETRLVYDTFGNLVARYEPAPDGTPLDQRSLTTYQYDDANRLSALTAPMGATTNYEYYVLGNQTAVVDARGARTELEYDRAGRVKAERKFLDERTVYTTSYDYDGAGRLTAVTDANSHTRRTEYDGVGRVKATFDALDHRTSYEYDLLGRLQATVDPLGRRTAYTYDPMGRVIGVADPLGSVRSFGYNKLGDRTSAADAEGRMTRYGYDLNSRLESVTDPRLLAEGFSYDGLGNKMSWTTSAGETTSYRYDPRSNLSQVAEPGPAGESLVTVYDYDARGNHVSQLDPEGRETDFEYDLADRLVAERSDGLETAYHYDATGNRVEVIDGRGLTSYVYDLLGRVIEVHYPGGEVESFTYDGVGNVLTRTDSSGTTAYTYDPNDRPESVTDPTGTTLSYEYDPAGNLVSQVVDEHPTSMEFDAAGRLRVYTDRLGHTYSYDYDQSGLLTGLTGPSYQTGWAYGANGRPTGVETTTAGGVAAMAVYVYDDRNFVAELSEDGRQTSYRYDARGQLTEVITPAGDVIRYGFDGSGNRTRREAVVNGATTDRGQTIEPLALLRLILKNLRDEHPDVLAEYGVLTASGNNAGSSPGGGNGPGPEASQGQGKGNGDDKTPPGQDKTPPGQGNKPPGQDDDKLTGRENALTRGNGLKIGLLRKFEADEHGIVANIIMILERIVNGETHVPPGDMTGLETIVREAAAGYTLVGQEFTYNELNQLTSVYDPLRDETFNYSWDEAGGLVQTGTADLTWDEQGRLTRIVWADGWGIEFTYDAQGRRLSKTTFNHRDEGRQTTTFHYLAGGKQVLWEDGPGGRLDYTYDPTGRRLTVTHEDATYWYVYNGHGDVVGLVDETSAMVARYEYDDYGRVVHMWGADGQEVREGQGQIHYLNGDITVGDVSPEPAPGGASEGGGVTPPGNGKGKGQGRKGNTGTPSDVGDDGTGQQAGAGTSPATADDGGEIAKLNPYRYASYRYDRETELYFLESRYYDLWSNRFISRDSEQGSATEPLTLNRYLYALNNGPNVTDPLGKDPVYLARNIPRTYDAFYRLDDVSRIKVVQAMLVGLGLLAIPDGPVEPKTDDMEKRLDIDALFGPNTAGGLAEFWGKAGLTEPIGVPWDFYMGEKTYRALVAAYRRVARRAVLGPDWSVRYSVRLTDQPGVGPILGGFDRDAYWPLDAEYYVITSGFESPERPEHAAIDIGVPFHARVYAAMSGKVGVFNSGETDQNKGNDFTGDERGNYILLIHKDSSATRYLHLTAVLVGRDEEVSAGQVIGTAGATGHSHGVHLHFDYGKPTPDGGLGDRINPLEKLYRTGFIDYLREVSLGKQGR